MGVGSTVTCYVAAYAMVGWMYVLYIGYSDRYVEGDDLLLWWAFLLWPMFVVVEMLMCIGDAIVSMRERLDKYSFVRKVFRALAVCMKAIFNPHWLGRTIKERVARK